MLGSVYGFDFPALPLSWLSWLATTDLRLTVYAWRGLYGAVRFLHLVSMATFVGTVVILDLRGLGLFPPAALDAARPRLGRVLTISFALALGTGVALFLRDPIGAGLHTMFVPKLVLIAVGYGFARWLRPRLRRVRPAGAMVSLAIWLLVIGASTWNHVERPVRVGEGLRLHTLGK